ncbi:MAG TPA: hypothetical protein VFV61_04950, partial [Pyrinomonadaceae bacterium]|nr:hypothetical protein [Pyrinomonadaceae bacterium]
PVTGLVITNGTLKGVSVKSEAGPEEYFADLVIDATGRTRALVRRVNQLSTRTKQHKAPFVAFKAHLRNARAHAGACEIYFYDGGYGGLNSIEGDLSNLCFIVSARVARANNADPERVMRQVVMRNERAATTLKEAQAAQSWMAVSLEQFGRQTLVPVDGLLTAGDAAAFIDPFTGSGILMALESGELIATTILSHLMKACFSFARLADDYRAAHAKVFDSRLRMSALLRRAAFMPRLTAAAIFLSGNDWLRRMLTRATRGGPDGGPACFYRQELSD